MMGRDAGLAIAVALGLACGPAAAGSLPRGEGYPELRRECTRCHTLHNIELSDGDTAEGWQAFVEQMTDIEARPEQRDKVVAYLALHFPPGH